VEIDARRRGTRVRAQIPLYITSLDSVTTFSESCHTVLVNPQGCGVRFKGPLKQGLRVRVDHLPGGGNAVARVACSLPPTAGGKYWLIGIGLEVPGNLWCLAPSPSDWGNYASVPKFFPTCLTALSGNSELLEVRRSHTQISSTDLPR
jgi:hypothetical protein